VTSQLKSTDDARFDGGSLLHGVFFAGPLAMSAIPLLTPIFFAGFCVTLIGTARRRGAQWHDLLYPTPAIVACLILAIYVLLNATWSANPTTGLRKAAVFASLLLMSFTAVHSVALLEKQTYCRSGPFFAAGVFGGALFILAELLTHGLTSAFVMSWIPILYPHSPENILVTHGRVVWVKSDQLNHNVGILIFSLWPGLLVLSSLKGRIRMIAIAVFFVTISAVVMISAHAASQLALLGSIIVVLAMWYWQRYVVRALAVLWCLSFVFVIPASFVAYQSGLHLESWLPNTARQRIIIWQYTAEQVFNHPWIGVGVESTPVLNRQQTSVGIEKPEGFAYPRILGSHAHNIFLQTWFELGAVGAFLFAVAGAAVITTIALLPTLVQPFAAGSLVAFAIVGALSWNMWQVWFMCSAALLPLYLRVAAVTVENRERGAVSPRVHSL
jgi:O-antigen ligase